MALHVPDSMNDIIYWTNRAIDKGKAIVWVPKQTCPKCKKATMGKPVGENGGVKIRAKEYVCPACQYTVEKQAYEETLTANALYTCPSCLKEGEFTGPFKRKNVEGVLTFRFSCGSCGASIDVTKKMKTKRKKGTTDVQDDE